MVARGQKGGTMGPYYPLDKEETPRQAEVREVSASEGTQRLLWSDEAILLVAKSNAGEHKMSSSQTDRAEIVNHGQIVRMTFPAGWVEGPKHSFSGGIGTRSFREFHPEAAPQAMMCLYYRGLPISDDGGAAFRAVLEKPVHPLTADEMKAI